MRSFVPAMLALLLLAAVLRIDIYFAIVYFMVAVFVLARLWSNRAFSRLKIHRRFTDRVFSGEAVPIDLMVQNGSRLPVPWLEIVESTPHELRGVDMPDLVLTLGPRERRVFRYTLTARKRGYYRVGPLSVRGGDILDIQRKHAQWFEDRPLIVYPRIVPIVRAALPAHSAQVALPTRSPLFEDPSRVIGVRDYRRGDSPRRIHWTATARAGQLLVKQFQPAIARDTLICLDFDAAQYENRYFTDATEMAVVIAASLANRVIVNQGLTAGLLTEAWDPMEEERRTFLLPARRERSHLVSILEVLARIGVTRDAPLASVLRRQQRSLAWGTTLVIVTGRIDDDLAETAILLRRGGLATSAVLVHPPGSFAESQVARWSSTGVPIRRIWTDGELAAWR
jgi:uncharacterized protein (DUF58 family)